ILISGDANFWYESGGVADVTIRNNTFEDCCTGAKNQAVILIEPIIKNPADQDHPYHKNITIERNTIKTFDRNLIRASSVENLVIKDNKFVQTHTFTPIYPEKKEVEVSYSRDVNITGNSFEGDHTAGIMIDSTGHENLTVDNNRNMILLNEHEP
ncbi:MAG TPA: right-handed parallel beta-helix repeat-containing protein, partial [Bacteroidales bacterium]|nr:right-handed parallel beta-helix repeat-containing protein [Bacteroidales bacterium]